MPINHGDGKDTLRNQTIGKKKQAEVTQFLRNPRNISENAQIMLIYK